MFSFCKIEIHFLGVIQHLQNAIFLEIGMYIINPCIFTNLFPPFLGGYIKISFHTKLYQASEFNIELNLWAECPRH